MANAKPTEVDDQPPRQVIMPSLILLAVAIVLPPIVFIAGAAPHSPDSFIAGLVLFGILEIATLATAIVEIVKNRVGVPIQSILALLISISVLIAAAWFVIVMP